MDVKLITCLRATGMPLDQIKQYFDLVIQGEDTVPERYQIMLKQQQKTLDEINELQNHLTTINYKVAHYADLLINHQPDSFEPSNIQAAEKSTEK
ncbi:hypothetical protein FHL03_11505 [Lactobacillus salsicarnum]|uniref:Transcription regulator MerR DNA binding domain-containing protein n=2 Tax=Companilactobacillus mishanensis TaxID=2486008 RepID=A0ABW9PAA4_9LACO|nr:hypothetical protein [Companilactobacillus mishanensis]